jgi:hypothetical protein
MAEDFRKFEDAADYEFGAPDGAWTARLDHKAWGKSSNLILYFTNLGTGQKHWFSVFWADGYRPRDKAINFKDAAEPDEIFEVATSKTKSGNHVFLSARKAPVPAP